MIYVGGLPFSPSSSSASALQEYEVLVALLEHPMLLSASNSFKELPELKMSDAQGKSCSKQKHVYVFQREYATVYPERVDFIGTDEATTCVGLVLRNQKDGMTSVAHLDSPKVVALGLNSMLSSLCISIDAELDVHLVGGYEDSTFQGVNHGGGLEDYRDKIETSTGFIRPACFDRSSRIPDEIVRRLRVSFSFDDPAWKDKLLETYDTHEDKFSIAPCCWDVNWKYHARKVLQFSDSKVLQICSTSPDAESPEFVENIRRVYSYLVKNPDWRKIFPSGKPRVFKRTDTGGWAVCE